MGKRAFLFTLLALIIGIVTALASSTKFNHIEIKDFYVDSSGNPLPSFTEYPYLGPCTPSHENCYGTFTRENPAKPWILKGSLVKGRRILVN